ANCLPAGRLPGSSPVAAGHGAAARNLRSLCRQVGRPCRAGRRRPPGRGLPRPRRRAVHHLAPSQLPVGLGVHRPLLGPRHQHRPRRPVRPLARWPRSGPAAMVHREWPQGQPGRLEPGRRVRPRAGQAQPGLRAPGDHAGHAVRVHARRHPRRDALQTGQWRHVPAHERDAGTPAPLPPGAHHLGLQQDRRRGQLARLHRPPLGAVRKRGSDGKPPGHGHAPRGAAHHRRPAGAAGGRVASAAPARDDHHPRSPRL
ncbi:MAG: FIG00933650: hypothetical protein, partial [uncultured Ramlibacter sp.]